MTRHCLVEGRDEFKRCDHSLGIGTDELDKVALQEVELVKEHDIAAVCVLELDRLTIVRPSKQPWNSLWIVTSKIGVFVSRNAM